MSELKMLAIDLGASSGRGIVGTFDGNKIALRENHRFTNDPVNVNGRFTWDILRIFHEIKQSITKTVLEGDNIRSIGIDSWGVDYAFIDKHGRMMANPTHYRDLRTDGITTGYMKKFVTPEEVYGVTGIQAMDFNTINQLAADMRDNPEVFDRADKMLFIPDLLNYFLTGRMATEYTIASTGAILDAEKRAYAMNLLKKLGIPETLFTELVQPTHCMGGLLPQILSEVGKCDAKVYNVAAHDTASAVISVPVQNDDFIYISSGTWSLMGAELKAPMINEATKTANFTNEGGVQNTIRFLKNIMGLWIIQESRRQWKREGKDYSFYDMEMAARGKQAFRSLINPDDKSFATPGNMPGRICEYCARTNQHVPEDMGEVVRTIYESLALKYRYTVDGINGLMGRPAKCINVVGGGTKDGFLSQLTSDACNVPVVAGPEEATAVGNLMMQTIAAGEVKDLAQARAVVANSFALKHYEPTADRAAWDEAYGRFCELAK